MATTSQSGHLSSAQSQEAPVAPASQAGPSSQFTNGLLVASGTAFITGIFGSLWYQGRQDRRKGIGRIAAPAQPGLQSLNDLKMAENLLKEGRLLGVKAFAIATTLCVSSAFLIVGGTRWALDVQTIPEFSAKMKDLFPKQKIRFVEAVVEADRSVFGGQDAAAAVAAAKDSLSEPVSTPSSTSSASSGSSTEGAGTERDLDHEEDGNILSRLERELKRLEAEEA